MKDWINLTDLGVAADLVGSMRFSRNLMPQLLDIPEGRNFTVIAPHPDDEMLGPGGTLLHSIEHGVRVRCIYLTSGNPGEGRLEETEKIAARYGYEIVFLNFPPNGIPINTHAAKLLRDAILDFPPDVLFIPFILDDHDEHRRANQLLLHAYEQAQNEQQRNILGNMEIWAYQVYTALPANVIVDITDYAEKKAEAIRGWKSQAKSRDWAHFSLGLNAFNSRFAQTRGKAKWVESFFVVPVQEYIDWCARYFADEHSVYYMPEYKSGPLTRDADTSTVSEE